MCYNSDETLQFYYNPYYYYLLLLLFKCQTRNAVIILRLWLYMAQPNIALRIGLLDASLCPFIGLHQLTNDASFCNLHDPFVTSLAIR